MARLLQAWLAHGVVARLGNVMGHDLYDLWRECCALEGGFFVEIIGEEWRLRLLERGLIVDGSAVEIDTVSAT